MTLRRAALLAALLGCVSCVVEGAVGVASPVTAPPPDVDAGAPSSSDAGRDAGEPPGLDGPLCVVALASVNGQPDAGLTTIEPLDDVVLSGAESTPGASGSPVTRWSWSILESPPSSHVELTDPAAAATGFFFADDRRGVDHAGRYVVRLRVEDELGRPSVNRCELSFDAVPSQALLLQLSWDTEDGDVDLHLLKQRPDGRFCVGSAAGAGPLAESCAGVTDGDCYFGNCRSDAAMPPDWDDAGPGSDGDPSLDVDDRDGFGPENITLRTPPPGEYLVGVHGFSLGGPALATVRLFLFGQLHAVWQRSVDNGEWWEVARIEWPASGTPCVDDLSSAGDDCP
jgi:hypothetical protein